MLLFVAAVLLAAAVMLWRWSRPWKMRWKIPARIGTALLALLSPLALLLFGVRGLMCGRYDFLPVQSPNESWVASVSEEDCGATDSFHSSVEIWRHGWYSLFVPSERIHRTVFSISHDPRRIELEWKGTNQLLIRYPNDSNDPEEFLCRPRWADVQIQCVSYTPDYDKAVGPMPPVKKWWY